MTYFVASIDFSGQPPVLVAKLKNHLALSGFRNTLTASNDASYELPKSQFIVSRASVEDVVRLIECSAKASGLCRAPQITISRLDGCLMVGLRGVVPPH
jgi:Endoribonuclease GhoS